MPVTPRIGFILVCIFLDALGIGLIVPVLPRLIGELAVTRDLQTTWYGAIMLSYGVMQFLSAPLLGALSDRIGRRPVLLGGILGLGLMFAVPAFSTSLWFILGSRILGLYRRRHGGRSALFRLWENRCGFRYRLCAGARSRGRTRTV